METSPSLFPQDKTKFAPGCLIKMATSLKLICGLCIDGKTNGLTRILSKTFEHTEGSTLQDRFQS